MSAEVAAGPIDRAALETRAAAYRLAFGVTGAFALGEWLGWEGTFLPPMLAAQMLVKLPRPPSIAQGLGVLVLIAASTGIVLVLTTALISKPLVLLLTLAVLLFVAFHAHLRGAPELATLLPQISAVSLPVIAVLSPDSAAGFATMLLWSGLVALLTVWAAHAVFPSSVTVKPAGRMKPASPEARLAVWDAFASTLVLMPVLTWFVMDATEVAVVILIVILTILRQPRPAQGQRAALGLILGNLVGGTAAAAAYNLVTLRDEFLLFVMVSTAASLVFAGRIVMAGSAAAPYVIAFTTFILLLGLGLSPLPGSSGEAFVDRLVNVLVASAYAVGASSLVAHRRSVGQPP